MDSMEEYDPTLPLDMDRTSVNITNLRNQSSIAETSAMSDPGHAQMSSANLLTLPAGRMSPVAGRMSPVSSTSMKDYATQISDLKKENFSLKLRIFYMEERMQQQFNDDYEQVFKTNIELKVECDSLRRGLQDKHELLVKASNAVACLEGGPDEIRRAQELAQRELQQVKDAMSKRVQEADKELRAVRAEADSLAENIHKLQDYAHKLEQDNENLKKDLDSAKARVETVTALLPSEDETKNEFILPGQVDLLKGDLQKKERLIDQLRETLEVKRTIVEALSDEKKLEDENLEKHKEVIENLEDKNGELENELTKRKQQDERLRSDYMEYLEMEHEYQQHISEQQQRLDEFEIAARQMSEELEKREEEVKDLSDALKDAEETGKELADKYDQLKNEKEEKKLKELLMRDKAISGLTQVIKKRDEETTRLKEDAAQRETRFEEITNAITKLNSQEEELDERLRRLKDLERQVNQLKDRSAELEKKNRNITTQLEDSEELVRSLDEQLKEKDKKLQDLLTKYKELLKKQRARLENSEEPVQLFEEQLKEKDEKLQDLHTKYIELLKKQEFENSERPVESLEEQLREKDTKFQDGHTEYIELTRKQQLENGEELVRSLKEQLKEKDEKIQDLLTTRNKEPLKKQQLGNSEELVRSFDEQLKEKDKKLQDLLTKYKELLKKQQETELAKIKALKKQEDMVDQFEREKREFAEMLNNMKRRFEELTTNTEEKEKTQEILRLQEKLQTVEAHLRLKQLQLEADSNSSPDFYPTVEATGLFKSAENERKAALDELEAAMMRRDEEHCREIDSRNRIGAAKSAEIERLREEIRVKDDRIQDLEEDNHLQLDRVAHEARDKAVISARETARWKADSARKDSAIEELTKSLEDVENDASNSAQKQLIKLTRENVELKQLLKAREAELTFLQNEQAAEDPYIESLKREIVRKDKIIADERQLQDSLHNAFVTWSKISEDTSSMNLALDTLRLELENHKEELNSAKNMIATLTTELEASNQQLSALHEAYDEKDRLIEDLKASRRYPTVESEEGSSTVTDNLRLSPSRHRHHNRQQRFTKRKSKHRNHIDDLSTQSSSTISALKFHTDNDDFEFLSSENDFSAAHRGPRIKEELKNEIQSLHREIEALKDARKDETHVQDLLRKLELQKDHLRRLANILTEEQKIYRNQLNLSRLSSHSSHSESGDGTGVARSKRQLDRTLKSVEHVRDKLRSLLLEVARAEDASIQVNDDTYQSIGSTLFPLNQTSYMDVPVHDRSDHTTIDERENVISELQTELEQTRAELGVAVKELADLQAAASEVKQLKDQLGDKQREIQRLEKYSKDMKKQGERKEAEMSALRIEVDQLRSLRLKVGKDSDTDHQPSMYSGDESDGMGSLSRRELRDSISNLNKKLKNAEKLNELLGDQIESARQEKPQDSVTVDPNLTQHLSSEIERLKEQLKNAQERLRNAEDQARKSPHGRSPKYSDTEVTKQTSKSKLPVPVEKSPSKANDSPSKEKQDHAQLKAQCTQLKNKLAATEETVRQQTEKLKKCKAAMVSAGIPLSPIKSSQSHPDSFFGSEFATARSSTQPSESPFCDVPQYTRDTSSDAVEIRTQTSADDTGYGSVSPKSEEKYNSLIQAQAKELSALRQKLKKARETCKALRTEYDIVVRYVTTLLNTSEGKADTMLAASVTNELDRCKQLTRRLKEQLSECSSDGSLSTDSDETVSSRKKSLAQQQATQLLRKSQEIDEKNRKIRELEDRLANLVNLTRDSQPSYQKIKGQRILPENLGYLTPTSSHHSMYTNTEEDLTPPVLRPTISQSTEYAPLPDCRSPRLSKSLPMFQRTIAVTEYSTENDDAVHGNFHNFPGGRRLLTAGDSENCSAAYGGSWSAAASPRKQRESRRLSSNYNSPIPSSRRDDSEDMDEDAMHRKLEDSQRLNESLKEELDLTNEALKQATLRSTRGQMSRNPADILEEHLNEIRALRKHLEASIETNNRLRAQLERKLRHAGVKSAASEHVSTNIYLPADASDKYENEIEGLRQDLARGNDEIAKLQNQLKAEISMKNNFAAASRELEQLRMRLVESSTQTEMLGTYIDDLNRAVTEKDDKVESLQTQVDSLLDDLKQLHDEKEETKLEKKTLRENADAAVESANRMREDFNRLNEELDESRNLVRSLKSELALYEKFHQNKGLSDARSLRGHDDQGWSLDISEFLSEIKNLRVQLERSIEANGALREQLQAQLRYNKGDSTMLSPGRMTTINIHHLPPNSPGRHEDDILEERKPGSGRSSNTKRKLNMTHDEKPPSFLMTPPPSASSCGDEHSLTGFEFAPLPSQGPVTSTGNKHPNVQRPYYDLHGAYVLGKVTDYNELKRILTDGRLLIQNLELQPAGLVSSARTPPKSRGSNDLEESLCLLHKMFDDSRRILKLFWPASVPPPSLYLALSKDSERVCQKCSSRHSDASSDVSKCTKDAGFASDSSINSEADGLRREVRKLHKRLSTQDKLIQSTVDRLHTANRLKEGIEHAILRQLTVTHDVLKKARGNLEAKAGETHPKERQLPST